jgi:hypothetical protein
MAMALKPALKQHGRPVLNNDQIIPALAFMTFGIVIVYAIGHFFSAMRKRNERQQTPLTRSSEQKREREGSIIKK